MVNYKKIIWGIAAICLTAPLFAQKLGKPVPVKANGATILLQPYWAAPLVVDFDRDGLEDLIVGNISGYFRFYKNTGSKTAPEYKDFSLIQANGKNAKVKNW